MHRVDLNPLKGKKTALVLSGGVVKAAAWHLGVSLALDELGFTLKNNTSQPSDLEIGTYVGSSAGALINLYFASGFTPTDIVEANLNSSQARLKPVSYKEMLSFKRPSRKALKSKFYDPFSQFPTFLKILLNPFFKISGLFTTQKLKEYLEKNVLLAKSYNDYLADLFIVATQLDHSRKVIFSKYQYPSPYHDSTAVYYTDIPIAESAAASMSVPPFYSPFPIDNPYTNQVDYYIDGEIRETLSTHVAIDNQCDFIISSWTHTPYHYHDEIGSLANYGLPAICTQAIYLMIQKKIISNRAKRENAGNIINTVHEYMKKEKFSDKHRLKITNILERKLNYNPNINLIDIYPKHENYNLFFKSSFSLNSEIMSEIVNLGYKRTLEIFKEQEWEN